MSWLAISRALAAGASLFITVGLWSQALKVWRTRSAKDFTSVIIMSLLFSELAWLNYGITLNEWPIILIGSLCLPADILLVIGYIKYHR